MADTIVTNAGVVVDTGDYGQATSIAFGQPFWDDVHFAGLALMGIEGDMYGASPWDVVTLNGKKLPGLWEATATPAIQIDLQRPNNYDGAALLSRGYIPAGVTITGRIWTPQQWEEFQRVLPSFWAPPNHPAVNDKKRAQGQIIGKQDAIAIEYPGLAAVNIHSIVLKQVNPPEKTGDIGVRQIKMVAIQYVPEPLKKVSAVKKASGAGRVAVDRTVQAQKILRSGARGQVAAAAAGLSQKPEVPSVANIPKPPSIAQARARVPKVPSFTTP